MSGLLRNWAYRHAQNFLAALGRLTRQPIASLLTIAVIGTALALPAGLSMLVRNGESLAGGWETVRDFSVYMVPGADEQDAKELAQEMTQHPELDSVRLITADEALEELRSGSGLGDLVDALEENPIPHTLVLRPNASATADSLDELAGHLEEREAVDSVRLDTAWVERLNAALDLIRRSVWLLASLLAAAVVIITGNTIRLDIQNRKDEIEVCKLLGASDGFVRRPFLYVGLWYGLLGGLFALLLLALAYWSINGPARRLADLYGSDFQLLGPGIRALLIVMAGGLLAGWSGAWIAASRHLRLTRPSR